jgi:hypothetical protein
MRLLDSHIIIYCHGSGKRVAEDLVGGGTVCSLADLPNRSARLSSNNTRGNTDLEEFLYSSNIVPVTDAVKSPSRAISLKTHFVAAPVVEFRRFDVRGPAENGSYFFLYTCV